MSELNIDKELVYEFTKSIGAIIVLAGIVYAVIKYIANFITLRAKKRESYRSAFDALVSQLTSDNRTSQLSAAILLRRYFKNTHLGHYFDLKRETINVISSLLRTIPTSVFQKTLADGLAYAVNLSRCDLQKTNLQDALIDSKYRKVKMNKTDLFLSDLSYANLKEIKGHGIIFYQAILFCAKIKRCDFKNANFNGADLTNVSFEDCILEGASFKDAINIPPDISKALDKNGCFTSKGKITAKHESKNKSIFFSMPGVMSKEDELLTKEYKRVMEKHGYKVIYYQSDDYPCFGQFNKIREKIMGSVGMIAFGLKQLHIQEARYRPGTQNEEVWKEKWMSTPWNEIEVGMGLMKGMPILLVSDPFVCNAVFDTSLSECFVAKIATTEDSRKIETNTSFHSWLSKL